MDRQNFKHYNMYIYKHTYIHTYIQTLQSLLAYVWGCVVCNFVFCFICWTFQFIFCYSNYLICVDFIFKSFHPVCLLKDVHFFFNILHTFCCIFSELILLQVNFIGIFYLYILLFTSEFVKSTIVTGLTWVNTFSTNFVFFFQPFHCLWFSFFRWKCF